MICIRQLSRRSRLPSIRCETVLNVHTLLRYLVHAISVTNGRTIHSQYVLSTVRLPSFHFIAAKQTLAEDDVKYFILQRKGLRFHLNRPPSR